MYYSLFKLLTERYDTYTTYDAKQYNISVDYLNYLPCVTYITRIRLRIRIHV